jgi:hypothetical protein
MYTMISQLFEEIPLRFLRVIKPVTVTNYDVFSKTPLFSNSAAFSSARSISEESSERMTRKTDKNQNIYNLFLGGANQVDYKCDRRFIEVEFESPKQIGKFAVRGPKLNYDKMGFDSISLHALRSDDGMWTTICLQEKCEFTEASQWKVFEVRITEALYNAVKLELNEALRYVYALLYFCAYI